MNALTNKTETNYASAFAEVTRHRQEEPGWLHRFRENSFNRFREIGFPSVAEEEWKYTSVTPIVKTEFAPVIQSNGSRISRGHLTPLAYEEAQATFAFINGIFRRDLSDIERLPANVIALDLKDAIADQRFAAGVQEVLNRHTQPTVNGFVALNNAMFAGGLLLSIPSGATLESPIHLLFLAEATNGSKPAASPRVLVNSGANSIATIIESYVGSGDGAYLTNAVIDFDLEDSAQIRHYRVQRESPAGFHIATTTAVLGSSAKYETTSINLGAAISRHNIDVLMDHEGAECAVDGLYMVDGKQHTDTHSIIDHRKPHCTSHQLYKGILDGKSRAVFNGKVFVRHGALQTDAQQTNKNLLLSNEAHVDTKPQLEIFADDVKCAHGAAVGQLEEDELFYLESRGLNPALAKNLLTYGFAEEVIEKIKVESIKRELDETVLNRLRTTF